MSFQKYNIADLGTATLNENIGTNKDSFSIININNLPAGNSILTLAEKGPDNTILYIEKIKYTLLQNGVLSGVTRGFGGTQKRDFTQGAIIRLNIEVEVIKDLQNEVSRLESVKANDNIVMKLSGNQTASGEKYFSGSIKTGLIKGVNDLKLQGYNGTRYINIDDNGNITIDTGGSLLDITGDTKTRNIGLQDNKIYFRQPGDENHCIHFEDLGNGNGMRLHELGGFMFSTLNGNALHIDQNKDLIIGGSIREIVDNKKIYFSGDKWMSENSSDGEILEIRQHSGQGKPGLKITDQNGTTRILFDMNGNNIRIYDSGGNQLWSAR